MTIADDVKDELHKRATNKDPLLASLVKHSNLASQIGLDIQSVFGKDNVAGLADSAAVKKIHAQLEEAIKSISHDKLYLDTYKTAMLGVAANHATSDEQVMAGVDWAQLIESEMTHLLAQPAAVKARDAAAEKAVSKYRAASGGAGAAGNGDDSDDDLVMVNVDESEQATFGICCVSGVEVVDPVRNKVCRHVYSRESVENLLQQEFGGNRKRANDVRWKSGSISCPSVGCNKQLSLDSVEDAPDIAQTLARKKKRAAAIAAASGKKKQQKKKRALDADVSSDSSDDSDDSDDADEQQDMTRKKKRRK